MQSRAKNIGENLLCLLIVAAVAVLPFYPALQGEIAPLSLGSIFVDAPWEGAADMTEPVSAFQQVQALRYYPWLRFMAHAIEAGESLHWNPYEGTGTPFMAAWETRVCSPFSLPYYFLPLLMALGLSCVLKLLVAGLCAFYAARRFGFAPPMALMAAVIVQLSGPVFLWCGFPLSDVVPWLPLFVVQVERISLRQYRFWPLAAIAIALMALGGDPGTLFVILLFGLLVVILRNLLQGAYKAAPFAALVYGAGIAFGLALAGLQLVPWLEFIRHASLGTPVRASLKLWDIAALLVPRAYATARIDDALLVQLLHVGLVPMLLVPLWLAARPFILEPQRLRFEVLVLVSVLFSAVPLLAGGYLYAIPGLRHIPAQSWVVTNATVFALLAAASVRAWLELNAEDARATLGRLILLLPACWAVLLIIGIAAGALTATPPFFWTQVLVAAVVMIVCMALIIITLLKPNRRLLGYGLAALAALQLGYCYWPSIPQTPAAEVFPESPLINSLQQTNSRIVGSPLLQEWPLLGNLVPQIHSPSGIHLPQVDQFLAAAAEDPLLLRRAGSEYLLLSGEDIRGAYARLRPRLNIEQVYPQGASLFSDMEGQSRAYMVYEGRKVEIGEQAPISSAMPPLLENLMLEGNTVSTSKTTITSESFDQVVISVQDTGTGVLVLADAWYPGWRVTVNGEASQIGRVEGAFRGVELGKGNNEVVFYYEPFSFRIGLWVSAAAALLVVLSMRHLVFGLRKRDTLILSDRLTR